MAEVAHGAQHDFWRPPLHAASELSATQELVEVCDRCGTEFIVGSRFCHNCGAGRPDASGVSRPATAASLQLGSMAGKLGLTIPSFIAFAIGVFCLIAAAAVSLIFSAKTVVDWQAIQLWRIEWLLGAIGAFVAGSLLKRNR